MARVRINDMQAQRSLTPSLVGLVVALAVTFGVAYWASQFEPGEWYRQLAKPSWTPPGAVFGPVWGVLYLLMALAAWIVWRKYGFQRAPVALGFYLGQLLLNGLWSYLFFGRSQIGGALIDIVLLLGAIVVTLVLFWRKHRVAGAFFVPYALWVGYATALNFQIWRLN